MGGGWGLLERSSQPASVSLSLPSIQVIVRTKRCLNAGGQAQSDIKILKEREDSVDAKRLKSKALKGVADEPRLANRVAAGQELAHVVPILLRTGLFVAALLPALSPSLLVFGLFPFCFFLGGVTVFPFLPSF